MWFEPAELMMKIILFDLYTRFTFCVCGIGHVSVRTKDMKYTFISISCANITE